MSYIIFHINKSADLDSGTVNSVVVVVLHKYTFPFVCGFSLESLFSFFVLLLKRFSNFIVCNKQLSASVLNCTGMNWQCVCLCVCVLLSPAHKNICKGTQEVLVEDTPDPH